MSGNLIAPEPQSPLPVASRSSVALGPRIEWEAPPQAPGLSLQVARYLSALHRYKWMIALIVLAGSALGVAASRMLRSKYEVHATIWISGDSPQRRDVGPIRAGELLTTNSWPDLLGSFAILDNVVRKVQLFITPSDSTDVRLFAGFTPTDSLVPGQYELRLDEAGTHYVLTEKAGYSEHGTVGDSIGLRRGFAWAPAVGTLPAHHTLRFAVSSVREASVRLREQVKHASSQESNLLRLSLEGSDPRRITRTMNALVSEFVDEAATLKRRNLTEFAKTLEGQLDYAARELRESETDFENFRATSITLPSESGPVSGGLELTRDPVITNYFHQKIEYDSVRHDRLAIETITSAVRRGETDVYAYGAVPSVNGGDAALRTALQEYAQTEASLRVARRTYTDEHQSVQKLVHALEVLRTQTIPQLATSLARQLERRETDLAGRIDGTTKVIRDIPTRTIEEMRLRRNKDAREALYNNLKTRYEEARLAEASAMPDVSILDTAAVPERPTHNNAPKIWALAFVASAGLAIVLALLLDRLDSRFHYPEQASVDLGLAILGAVPRLPRPHGPNVSVDDAVRVIEAFRSIGLNLRHACRESPLCVTISSPGTGDGKSLISANLSLSLAKSGFRTVLIDGDVRRGRQHRTFGARSQPGLLDVLNGDVTLDEALHATTQDRLSLMPCGTRMPSGPELLMSPRMTELLDQLRAKYDAIIVDSAPLGAGIDPFVLGTATRNLVLVVRADATDLRMARSKLELADRLPIHLAGAILNAVQPGGVYEHYSYIPGYAVVEEGAVASAQIGAGDDD